MIDSLYLITLSSASYIGIDRYVILLNWSQIPEELRDFFQKLRRHDQARAIDKQIDLVKAAVAAVDQRINDIDPRKLVDEALTSMPLGSASSSRASSVSIPVPES